MFILFASPEAAPFAKTGGLADVAGSLPLALRRLGVDARLVLPFYQVVYDQNLPLKMMIPGLEVSLGRETLKADVLEGTTPDGVPVYFIQREDFFDRPNLYGNAFGDYYDNLERFLFFSHAVIKISANCGKILFNRPVQRTFFSSQWNGILGQFLPAQIRDCVFGSHHHRQPDPCP
jgi:starch synthase